VNSFDFSDFTVMPGENWIELHTDVSKQLHDTIIMLRRNVELLWLYFQKFLFMFIVHYCKQVFACF